MGKKVIPEKVEYFCDVCGVNLSKEHHNDFSITTDEALRDFSGSVMNNHCDNYELCDKCALSFKGWLKGVKNENT